LNVVTTCVWLPATCMLFYTGHWIKAIIKHPNPRHAVSRVLIVSGDRDQEVRRLAEQVGIKEIHSAKSPEDKVAIVRNEAQLAPTLFLGDGINDAPAMQAVTVGVAFGVQSDITSEAADAVILETSLARVDELIHIARRMRHIALQSAIGGKALSIIGMFAARIWLPATNRRCHRSGNHRPRRRAQCRARRPAHEVADRFLARVGFGSLN